MREIRTEIDIYASDSYVWQILTDFARFPSWNPFIRSIAGEQVVGSQLDLSIQAPGMLQLPSRSTLLKIEPQHALRWTSHLLIPGLFDSEHSFILDMQKPNQIHFTHRKLFTGILSLLLFPLIESSTRRGFKEMNRALKIRAEQSAPALATSLPQIA